jgi:hypothetical protein
MTTYTHRPWPVAAIQWTGSNFADIEQFVRDNIGDPDDIGLRNEDDEYNMVQFYAWNDDQEVDPGRWIVVYLGLDEPAGEIMHPDEFRAGYEVRP